VPLPGPVTSPRLATDLAGLALPNPVGLAAGYDKNAVALAPLSRAGFGFLEVGAATPLPQPGNPKPRLFRLTEDRAAINRFGFNNDGAEAIGPGWPRAPRPGARRLNLGANKTSGQPRRRFRPRAGHLRPACRFRHRQRQLAQHRKLRDLQGPAALAACWPG
jgi:dihydroorotate dehydrogenase